MKEFESRIDLNMSIEELSEIVCQKYKLGRLVSFQTIEIGYEDFNYILETEKGKFVIKVFATFRSDEDAMWLTRRALTAYENGVDCPKIFKTSDNQHLCTFSNNNIKYRLIVMDYIDGNDFYSLGEMPSESELEIIAENLAKLNSIDYQPPFIYDHWAIVNFEKEYKENIHLLSGEDKMLVDGVFNAFKACDLNKLQCGFVHGDIIVTNIIKHRKSNKLYFIDFSVSNYLPRIVDLAVSICDLCLDIDDIGQAKNRMKTFIDAYEKVSPLSEYEKICLKTFLATHQAITILETTRELKVENNDSTENADFLAKGQKGLRLVLNNLI